MKCVVGIDLERRYGSVLTLLGRLKFDIDETTLLHVAEPIQLAMPYSAYGMIVETDDIYETLRKAGRSALDDAVQIAKAANLSPKADLAEGFPTRSLTDLADSEGASLIAVTSSVRSSVGAVFGGSVARGLAISAKQSVLVAREEMPADGPLRAVLATDQSPYCAECLKLLVKMAPKGIAQLTLLTVYERAKHENLLGLIRGIDVHATLDETGRSLEQKGNELAKWLTDNGIQADSRVVEGHIEETIHSVMAEIHADLLIVGSQGHGFLDRILVGSTSLHEITNERYPLLLLRPALLS